MSVPTNDPLPLAKVDAIIPRAQNPERVMSDLGFELEQRQPVRLIIATNHRGDKPHQHKIVKVRIQKDEVCKDGEAEINRESPMQIRAG